ncbi:unnamed protein product [Lampetra fluviatilis]
MTPPPQLLLLVVGVALLLLVLSPCALALPLPQVAFPDTPHYYSWAELRILATALGYPRNTIVNCLHSVGYSGELGLSSKELLKHIALGHLYEPLHFTYNLKTGYHNAAVIRKCIELLDARALSFPEIRSVALAFTAYDHLDQKGIEVEERTLIRALKRCVRCCCCSYRCADGSQRHGA